MGERSFESHGDPSAPTVVLLPSLGTNTSLWSAHVPRFVEAGFHIVSVHLRGQGRFAVPAFDWTLQTLVDDVIALLDHLGAASASLVGCSLGGLIAQAVAARHPERVTSLVLLGTAARFPPAETWDARIALLRAGGIEQLANAAVQRWLAEHTQRADPQVTTALRRGLLETDVDGFCRMAELLRETDLRPDLSDIRAETLILVGEQDTGTPVSSARELERGIPHSSLRIAAGARHLVNVDRPEWFEARVLQLLTASKRASEKTEFSEAGHQAAPSVIDLT